MTQTWWLSFADPDRPEGTQFLGVVILDVDETDVAASEGITTAIRASHGLPPLDDPEDQWMSGAVYKSHRLKVNPGGQVLAMRLDDAPRWPASKDVPRDQLLSWDALAAWGFEPGHPEEETDAVE